MLLQLRVQLVEHDARLHGARPRFRIERKHVAQIFREIDHQRFADRLSALRRRAAAGQERQTFVAGDLDNGGQVRVRLRHDNAERHDLIDRRIGGITPPRKGVEKHVTLDRIAQSRLQIHIST